MQTNSPLGVRSRCQLWSGSAIQCFRGVAAVLASLGTSLLSSLAPGQVDSEYYLERRGDATTSLGELAVSAPQVSASSQLESSPQLESLLGYERLGSNRPAVVASWKPQSMAEHPSGVSAQPNIATAVRSDPGNRGERILPVTPVGRSVPQSSRDPLDQRLPGPSQIPNRDESDSIGTTPGLGQGAKSLLQTGVALAIVLALLFCFVWIFKRTAPKSLLPLPTETLQVLGNAPLHGKQHLRLIRLGQRVLLLAVSETTSQTLAEVTDPEEVKHLLELCQGTSARLEAQTFAAVLREHGRERTKGFLGSQQDEVSQSIGTRGTTRNGASQAVRETDNRSTTRPVSNHFFEA